MTEADNRIALGARKGRCAGAGISCKDLPQRVVYIFRQAFAENERHACWIWKGNINHAGYGRTGKKVDGVWIGWLAHRAAYAWAYGEAPDGLLIMHSCDTPACFNPLHLFAGVDADNVRDKIAKGRQKFWASDGGHHPRARIVMAPDGRSWPCARFAAAELGISRKTIKERCRLRLKGWRHG